MRCNFFIALFPGSSKQCRPLSEKISKPENSHISKGYIQPVSICQTGMNAWHVYRYIKVWNDN